MRLILGMQVGVQLVKWMEELITKVKSNKIKQLEIIFNSEGGDAAFTELLKKQVEELESCTDVVIVNGNQVASAAVDFYRLFSKRGALSDSHFLIHKSSYCFENDSAGFIKKCIAKGEEDDKRMFRDMFDSFVLNGMTKSELNRVKNTVKYGGDYVIFKDEAVRWGLVNA